jgi:AAA15 family ATPase/GTPase
MLLAFRFRNFRSFSEKVELSFVAHKADKMLSECLLDPKIGKRSETRVLPAIAIYGANAAGKSNILLALDYMCNAIRRSHANWKPSGGTRTTPSLISADQSPSTFEADIALNGIRYNFGFTATAQNFVEEWLYSYPKGRERRLYHRNTELHDGEFQTDVTFGEHFSGDESKDLRPIVRRTRENSLFLSAAAQDNQIEARLVYEYFSRRFSLAGAKQQRDEFHKYISNMSSFMASTHEGYRNVILPVLKLADPSISDFRVSGGPGKELIESGIESFDEKEIEDFIQKLSKFKVDFIIKHGDQEHFIPFESESRGVQKIFGLFSMLWIPLTLGHVVVIDELESSMHPHLAHFIVDLFQNPEINTKGAQLIFTTHDSNLLDRTLLRRDQIWFVEKRECNSHLYSLLEFSPRKDENLEAGYLRGRYGAIPALNFESNWFRASSEGIDNDGTAL